MAAVAPSFEQCGVRIGEDAVKGKVVFAERDIAAGEVIFSEEAFVFAPWGTDVCDGCEEEKTPEKPECYCDKNGKPKEMYSETLTKNVELRHEVVEHMATTFESIAEVDHARCILKCLALYERDNKALDEVMKLTCANYEHCLEDAKELREHLPQIFPKDFTDEQMATLIGVLNTNSHELENLGGSGLFMSACRMEHNCDANCSFTTYDSTLWLTAIRPIKKGDALSIDYGNFYYRPTEERMSSLFESYGFVCTCDKCMKEPDTCRAFKCSNSSCKDGVVYPYPITPAGPIEDPEELEFKWECSMCGQVPSDEEQASFEEEEQELLEKGFPDSLAEVDEIVKKTSLHERHYLLFWAMDAIGCGAAAMSSVVDQTEEERKELAEIWERIISHMNVLIPGPHHEKTIYYDNLAQVQVVLDNRNAAMDAYRQAYEVSCIVSGRECTPTQKLKDLSENPPADAEELKKLYANSKRRVDLDVEWEDDDEEDDEDEGEEEE